MGFCEPRFYLTVCLTADRNHGLRQDSYGLLQDSDLRIRPSWTRTLLLITVRSGVRVAPGPP